MRLEGVHHITAITGDAPGNVDFYARVLGMRLVKKTVNQDDTSAYHLFYADGEATPGTDLTFFDWPAPPESRGTHAIARTGLRIAGAESFRWWKEHLNAAGVKAGEIAERDGRMTLDFEDPEGQRLSLIDDGGAGEAFPWEKSPVPIAQQIRGLVDRKQDGQRCATRFVRVVERPILAGDARAHRQPGPHDVASGCRPSLEDVRSTVSLHTNLPGTIPRTPNRQ